MENTSLQIKLDNLRLFKEMKKYKLDAEKNLMEKQKVKELIVEYKLALEEKNKEVEKLKKEKEILENNIKNIPDFVKNFFQN